MPLHQNDSTTKLSTDTLINDDHNGSFEDEENDNEHLHAVDHPDSQSNGGTIIKAYALYDFNGKKNKKISFPRNSHYFFLILQVIVIMVVNM
jgi:hypothetical protein